MRRRQAGAGRATRKAEIITLEHGEGAPLYRKVVQALRGEIAAGRLAIGARLPSEEELCRRFGVSRHTVREALRRLREEGLVSSRQGAGTTVLRDAEAPLYVHSVGSIEELVQYAVATRYRPETKRLLTADKMLAARLGCAPGSRWLKVEGLRYAPGEALPFCWTEVYVNSAYAGVGALVGRRAAPIYALIEEMYGEKVTEIEQTLRVTAAPAEVAPGLGIEPGSAAVELRRAYRLATGELAEIAFNLHPAERFTYSITLRRRR